MIIWSYVQISLLSLKHQLKKDFVIIINNRHFWYLFLLLFLDLYVSKFKVCLHYVGVILTYVSVFMIDFRLLWYPCHLICFTRDYLARKSCYCLLSLVEGSWRCAYPFPSLWLVHYLPIPKTSCWCLLANVHRSYFFVAWFCIRILVC